MIWITCIIAAYMTGHWIGWGRGYESGRRTGYVQGATDQEYAACRDQEDLDAIRRRAARWELN